MKYLIGDLVCLQWEERSVGIIMEINSEGFCKYRVTWFDPQYSCGVSRAWYHDLQIRGIHE
jgi:hypothetical protein